jgi:hypothetical protein
MTPPNKPNSSPEITEVNDWLIRQLKAWPTRIDPDRTTNIEYLMKRAAAAIEALSTKNELPSEIEGLREAVEHAAHVFRCYAELHDRKGTNEGREKARRNMEHAERMEAALNPKDTGHAKSS